MNFSPQPRTGHLALYPSPIELASCANSQSAFSVSLTKAKREIAGCYAAYLGMAAFPVIGKTPARREAWLGFIQKPGVYGDGWETATGYALAPVVGSNLVILDADNPAFAVRLCAALPRLAETFQVHRGGHIHFYLMLVLPLAQAVLKLRRGAAEIASLRGAGAYVVGPYSDHPASGERYLPSQLGEFCAPITLDLLEQQTLLDLFKAEADPTSSHDWAAPVGALPLRPHHPDYETTLNEVCRILRARGYKEHGEWLNGRCIHPERHAHQDEHISFGVNQRTGVGHCFTCGDYAPAEVAEALGLIPHHAKPDHDDARPYAFICEEALPHDGYVRSELNIAVALIRQGKHAAARLFDLLTDDSRLRCGQHTYHTSDLAALGKGFGLTRTQIVKATRTLVEDGLLYRVRRGAYQRVGIETVQRKLGLGREYALVSIPQATYRNVADYTAAITLAVEHLLPANLATATIGDAIGISSRSVYDHENRVGIIRTTNVKFTHIGQPTVCFAKVVDEDWRTVRTLNGLRKPMNSAMWDTSGGKHVLAWEQLPSTRQLPSLDRLSLFC